MKNLFASRGRTLALVLPKLALLSFSLLLVALAPRVVFGQG